MKDLYELGWKCQDMLQDMGIELGEVSSYIVNTRANSRWGLCHKRPDGTFDIQISDRLLVDSVKDDGAINTIIHELLHTVKGCMNHGEKWKKLAQKVYWRYGIEIKRTDSAADKGVDPIKKKVNYKHCVQCEKCGRKIMRQRETYFTRNPENYRCGACGGTFKIIF